jgi:hypothetical protein
MAKGVRRETVERIDAAMRAHPFALGPLLGRMARQINLSPATISSIIGTHEQTVFRWMFGLAEPVPHQLVKVARLIAIISWVIRTNRAVLAGTLTEREIQFARYVNEFKTLHRQSPA